MWTMAEVCVKQGYLLWGLCLMPDHLHVLLENDGGKVPLGELVRQAKSLSRSRVRGVAPLYWQAKYHDHVLRQDENPENRLRYLLNNPVRSGLADSWDTWPWSYANPLAIEHL